MKKLMIVACIISSGLIAFGNPGGPAPRGHAPAHAVRCPAPAPCRPVPYRPAPHSHHHGHHDFWGPGGRNFWPGFLGGVVGGAVTTAIVNQPASQTVVVANPTPVVVVQPQKVWVDGHYEDVVQPNGLLVRTWIPGHWETK